MVGVEWRWGWNLGNFLRVNFICKPFGEKKLISTWSKNIVKLFVKKMKYKEKWKIFG